jgi:iron-sulfur cluster repair protein YtfE (RIC family)
MAHEFIEHLLEDHEEQRKMGDEIRQAMDPEERQELWEDFHEELSGHLLGEEASIFPFLIEVGGEARKESQKALQEHHVAKLVIRELEDTSIDGETWLAKVTVLDELNKHHIDEEERVHIPMLVQLCTSEQLDDLFDQYEQAEEEDEMI